MNTRQQISTAAVACLALAMACTGQIGGLQPMSGSAGSAGGGGPVAASGAGSTSAAGPSANAATATNCNAITAVDPSPLRRLTNAEYANTVSDLLGANVSSLNLAFAAELTTEENPFLDNAAAQETPPELVQQYMTAAEAIAADTVTNRLSKVLTCDPVAAGAQSCAQTFISSFGAKALRRPLDADQTQALMSIWQVGNSQGNFNSGVQAVITAVLQMPEFLYRFEMSPAVGSQTLVPLDGWDTATRLSYLLWNSSPDDTLFAAAQAGTLQTPADITAQVTRMLSQPRAQQMVQRFHDEWWQLATIDTQEKDPTEYPKFSTAVATAMHQEILSLVDAVVFQGDGKIASLFTAPYTFMNDVLGTFYGVSGLSSTFTQVDQAMLGRPASGILTAGGLLAANAHANNTSPTKRGIFIREALLCQQLPPPPPNANITPPVPIANQTNRQAMISHVTNPVCASCHTMMDPIGFGFEGFDASGAWRTTEAGQPVDQSGAVNGSSDLSGSFNGPVELGAKLAGSDEVVTCAATQWFRFAFGRDPGVTSGDTCAVTQLHDSLKQGGELASVRAIPQTTAFLNRVVPQGGL